MTNPTPDLTHFFAIHRKMRTDTARYARAVETATPADRDGRLRPLAKWAKGFAFELEEHHFVEDEFFFPDMRRKVPSVGPILDGLDADHRIVDDLLARWTPAAKALADPNADFADAHHEALDVAVSLRDLLARHLQVEDEDVLPLYFRHYTVEEYDAVYHQALKDEKAGLSFVVPWNVTCLDAERQEQLVDLAPLPLKVAWWITRRPFLKLETAAFAGVDLADPVAPSR